MNKPTASFKSAEEYYAHDKIEPERDDDDKPIPVPRHKRTSNRVAWVSTRNLMTDDSLIARNIMFATAMSAEGLKREAGIKATGRKTTKPVQELTLAWHPGETPTRAEMESAANEVIKLLGIEEHQIAIYCHRDRPHPHIHLLINRVHPHTGKTATFPNAHRKLDKWANQYELRRGNIVTKQRAAKFRRMAKAKEMWPDDTERRAYVEQKRKEARERSPIRPKNQRWDKLKAAQVRADAERKKSQIADSAASEIAKADERQSSVVELDAMSDAGGIVTADPPPLPSQEARERPQAIQEAAEHDRATERRQEAQRRAQASEEHRRGREAQEVAEGAHRARLEAEKQRPEAEVFDAFFCAYEREQTRQGLQWDRTRNPAMEWNMALALRAMDKQQPELRQLLNERFNLPVDDPGGFRRALTNLSAAQGRALVSAVDVLDQRMDKEPGRNWKRRRHAFREIIDFYGQQRVLNWDGDSPQHIFTTTIKSICERSGLADFYRNTLKPLVTRLIDSVRSKQALELSQPDPDASPKSKGSTLEL
ncbi:relaxase/mobilization nuclease domain-containing protein [Jannaschia pohangensis]|nr:relaxase/mobilization nuclease domain-containing protein [Jannaschia pohangensis]